MRLPFGVHVPSLFKTPTGAALLSFLMPGLGQASAGSRVRGAIIAIPALAFLGLVALVLVYDRGLLSGAPQDQRWVTSLLALDATLFVYRMWAVLDACLLAARRRRPDTFQIVGPPNKWLVGVGVGVLLVGIVGVHAAVAEVDLTWQHALDCKTGAAPCWFDISYPQCGRPFPGDAEFGIVGVNHGIDFSANACLGAGDAPSELTWAGIKGQLYANTGDPGSALSSRWPTSQTTPRQCNTSPVPGPDTADCAYDYGWNAAADAYKTAAGAYVSLGLASPGATDTTSPKVWWLDVEINNSWQTDVTLNVADLEGAVAYLQSTNPAGIGFYSTQYQWHQITGGTLVFSAYPSWVAGAGSAPQAVADCSPMGFTGGRVAMVQYHAGDFDADYLCPR